MSHLRAFRLRYDYHTVFIFAFGKLSTCFARVFFAFGKLSSRFTRVLLLAAIKLCEAEDNCKQREQDNWEQREQDNCEQREQEDCEQREQV